MAQMESPEQKSPVGYLSAISDTDMPRSSVRFSLWKKSCKGRDDSRQPKELHTEEGQDLFSVTSPSRTQNNTLKLQEGRFWLQFRKKDLKSKNSFDSETNYLER